MPSQTPEFEGLLEAVPDALLGVGPDGLIRFVNHQTESLFGYERHELVGKPLEMLVPESVRQVHTAHREGYLAAPTTRPMGIDLTLNGLRRDGTELPVDIALSPMDTRDGILVVAAVRDMTRYRRAEADRRQLDRASDVVEFSGDAMISSTLDGVITSWNPAAERMYGYSSREIIGKSIQPVTPEDRTDEIGAILAKVGAGQTLENFETERVRKDGTVFQASLTISPIRDTDGAVVGVSVVCRDTTAQRQAFESAQLVAAIVEHSDDAIIGKTLDGIITSWNPAATRMYGYSSDEVIGQSFALLTPQDRVGEIKAILARIKAGEQVDHFETVRVRKDGTEFPVSLSVSPIRDAGGAVIGASTIARNLTRQAQAFDAARSMIESSLDSLVAISPEGRITDANQATVRVTGVPRDELIGTAFSDCFTDPEKANRIYQRVFTEGMAIDYPLTMRHRDGTLTEVLYNASVYRDSTGRVLGVFAAARDVTKQVQAQREIAERQARDLDRLAELERFQRLTVGRELKMIELKKEIEYLRRFSTARGSDGR